MIATDITKLSDKRLTIVILRAFCVDLKQFNYKALKHDDGKPILIRSYKKYDLQNIIKDIITDSGKSLNLLINEYNDRQNIKTNDIIMKTLTSMSITLLRDNISRLFKVSNYHKLSKVDLIKLFYDLIVKQYSSNINLQTLCNLLDIQAPITNDSCELTVVNNISEIQYIIHIADLHINEHRVFEYEQVFNNFIDDLISKMDLLKNKTIIVICGDIFHKKVHQKAESINLWNKFIKKACNLFPVVTITGNHDYDMKTSDIDWVSSTYKHDNFYHLNNLGPFEFNNIVFGISPLRPNDQTIIYNMKKDDPKKTYIQLYHGTINGSLVFNNQMMESTCKISDFGEFDALLLGDIHKMQYLDKYNRVAYSGSLIQQNKGESVFNHGYLLWDLKNDLQSEFVEVQNDYCYLKVTITNSDYVYDKDIIGNKKKIIVTYVLMVSEYDHQIALFQTEMDKYNIHIISSEFDKCYNMTNIRAEEYKSVTYDKSSLDYLSDYLTLQKFDSDAINNICDIHKSIKVNDETNISVSQWNIEYIEFKNVFCYGNNKINRINFDTDGFYKLLADNFSGKTSIINIIKWSFFGNLSNINDRDILYNHDKDNKDLIGYTKCKFNLANSNSTYILTKTINCSNKVAGVNIVPSLIIDDIEIVGDKNVTYKLTELVGSYQEFELISSINNTDLGILIDNPFKIFKTLFKLDRFDSYTTECKFLVKQCKIDITEKTSEINKLGNINSNDINIIKQDITNIKDQQSKLVFNDLTKLNKERSELIKLNSSIIIKDETIYNDNSELIKSRERSLISNLSIDELKQKYEPKYKIGEIFNDIQIRDIKVDIDQFNVEITNLTNENIIMHKKLSKHKLELLQFDDELDELQNRKNSLSLSINKVKLVDNDKLQAKIIELTEKCNNNGIFKIRSKLQQLNEERVSISQQINNTIIYNEDEIKQQISKQQFNYLDLKQNIINKLQNNLISSADYNNILLLLNGTDYHAMLNIIENNKLLNKQLTSVNTKIIKFTKEIETNNVIMDNNKCELIKSQQLLTTNNAKIEIQRKNIKLINQITQIDEHIADLKSKIAKLKITMSTLLPTITKNDTEINNLQSQIDKFNKYINNNDKNIVQTNYKQDLSILKELDLLNREQQLYLKYLENIKYNKQNRKLIESYNLQIRSLDDEILNKQKQNDESLIIKTKLDEQLIHLDNLLISKTNDLEMLTLLNIQLSDLTIKMTNLKVYYDILTNNKIPAYILTQNIKFIENYVNDILSQYTNYKIDIKISDFDKTRQRIDIYQLKNDNNNNLTINSLSGYESIILNIACKMAIKRFAYINYSSFISIDEVFGKISMKNYNLLPKLFDLIKLNYKHILIISHIGEIQELLNGKDINITVNKDYSCIC